MIFYFVIFIIVAISGQVVQQHQVASICLALFEGGWGGILSKTHLDVHREDGFTDMHLILTHKGPLIKTLFWWWGCRVVVELCWPLHCVLVLCVCVCVCDVTVTRSAGGIPPADATWFRHRSCVIVGVVVKHLRESHNTPTTLLYSHLGTYTRHMEGGTSDQCVCLCCQRTLSLLFNFPDFPGFFFKS